MSKWVFFPLLIVLSLAVCIITFSLLAGSNTMGIVVNFAVNLPVCLLLTVVYYKFISVLSRTAFFQRNMSLRIVVDFFSTTVVGVAVSLGARFLVDKSGWQIGTMTFVLWNTIIVLGIELYQYHRSMLEKEMQLVCAEKEKMAYQFETLKQQMNPHFLFNSLNVLASLAWEDAEKTNRFAKKLSVVYRYLLQTADKQFVTLAEELSFLNSYVFLEQIRFGNAVQVSISVDDALRKRHIVPVALQTLVENALKHNVATEEHPLHISVVATDNEIAVTNNLRLRDNVPTSKVGLSNLRKQYQIHGYDIAVSRSDEEFVVVLPLL